MVDPVIVGGAVAVVGIVAAAAYARLTGDDASAGVDVDGDGEDDVSYTFEGSEEDESTFGIEEAGGTSFDTQEPPEDPTPEHVQAKSGLTDVKGIGPTRAEDLGRAGFPNPEDLYYASDENLTAVSGIGDLTVSQIREDIGSVEDEGNDGESTEESQEGEDTDSDTDETDSEESSSKDTASGE